MKHIYKLYLRVASATILSLISFFLNAQHIMKQGPFQEKNVVAGKILVKLKTASFAQAKKNLLRLSTNSQSESFATGLTRFDGIARQFHATKMTRVFPNAGRMEAKQHKYGLDRWYIIEIDQATGIQSAINSFKQTTDVETVQPSFKIASITGKMTRITSSKTSKPLDASTPTPPVNDPFYHFQWHYHNTGQEGGYPGADINLESAWKVNAGKPNVIVDVVDEGVDFKHEDLAANMWVNQAELNGLPGVDDDGNGYVDDVYGYNFGDKTGTIVPGDHGTHTSGTIAAVNNNGIGVCGIAGGTGVGDGARIMSSEIFGNQGADAAGTAAAIVYGANNGAVISQNSWGYLEPNVYDQTTLDAIDYFTNEAGRDGNGNQVGPMNGGVVIFAAGNSNISDPSYPGYYPTAIAVGATNIYDTKASYSNYGDWVDIAAPGGDDDNVTGSSHQMVASTFANNGYGYMEGTSMACPHVSGVAALIVSQYGKMGFTNEDLKNRLFHSADQFLAMDPQYKNLMGAGRLDAGKALEANKNLPPVTITDLRGASHAQNSIDLNWTAPSDPDNKNAAGYTIYYSNHPIDTTQADTLPNKIINKALTAGSAETFNLAGLSQLTDYYISIRSKDLWGNTSAFSPVVKITTLAGPIVTLPADTLQLTINVVTSPTGSKSFKLSNKGSGAMIWNGNAIPVSSSWARQDGYDSLKWIDASVWTDGFTGDDARVSFSAATRFDVGKRPFNLTHVANLMNGSNVTAPVTILIYKGGVDPSKGTLVLKQTLSQIDPYQSLNVTKLSGMLLFQPGEWFWVVYQYDPAYSLAQGYQLNVATAQQQYFLVSSDFGSTWTNNGSGNGPVRFYTMALSNEGYPGGTISLSPASGNMPGPGSATIGVNGNATTMRNGTYLYNLQINSNDLDNPSANYPMIVNISGQKGTITSKIGLLDCSTVFIGKEGDATIKLYNAGLATLHNFSFSSDNNTFSSVSLPDSLNPGDSANFTIRFVPTVAGQQLAKVKITTNDGSLNLSASGVGVEPPVMDLTGVPVQIVAQVDSIGKNSFTISNKNGKYPLSYSMPEIAAVNKFKAKKPLSKSAAPLAKGTDPFLGYAWIDSQEPDGPVYSWDDISSTGKDITRQLQADVKSSALVNLGFPMKFYGDTIRQIYVNSQGTLTLNYPGAMNDVSLELPTVNDGINGEIAVLYYEQMFPVIGPTSHIFIKNAPGKLIVQWNDVEIFDAGSFDFPASRSLGKATFQAVLYSNGKIEMNYKTVNNTWATMGYPQIGLENSDETKGFSVSSYLSNTNPFAPMDGESLLFVPVTPSVITSIQPASGAVNPGDSVKIMVTASAAGLVDSTYRTSIALTTNDPLNEKLDIPVVFTVTGVQGMMQKTDTLAFGTIYKNASVEKDAVFLNTGTKPVKLISTSFSDTAYTTNQDTVSVPALSELHIPVNFKPTTERAYPATMTVTTNDSAKAVFTIVLSGAGKSTPSMSYSLSGGQTNTLNIGQTNAAVLTVKNTGDADLNIMVERPQWFEMDLNGQGVKNGLDSAHTYTIHKNIDSNSAAYNWVELAYGLGTPSYVDPEFIGAKPSQEVKLPFSFPFYGKKYSSLYLNWVGDVSLDYEKKTPYIYPTLPTDSLGGYISSANDALIRAYNWTTLQYEGQHYYYVDSEKLVVERYALAPGDYGVTGLVTFETIYYKDGRIKMLYKSGETESTFTQNFFVGIQNQDGTDASVAYNRSLWYKNHGVVEFVPSVPHTLKPGESIDMPATWTTKDMVDGIYKDKLVISTNDPLNAAVQIPLELDVNGTDSIKTTDTINFGKVVAYMSPVDGSSFIYQEPVKFKNTGTKTITITGVSFSNEDYLGLDELIFHNPDLFANPIILAPGEELLYHVDFQPDSTMTQIHETLTLNCDFPTPVTIPIIAQVTLPPTVTTDTGYVHYDLQPNDSSSQFVNVGNIGKGDLDYTLSLQYHRPGIVYNSVTKPKPLSANKSKKPLASLYAAGAGKTLSAIRSSVLATSNSFADSILAYVPNDQPVNFLGTSDPTVPISTATRFVAGKKGLQLSHVATLYRTDNSDPTTISFKIRLGMDINNSTVIYQQTVSVTGDSTLQGTYLIAKLDSSILINAYEQFWVEWDYNYFMSYPQGYQFVTTEQQKTQSFYTSIQNSPWYEDRSITSFYTAAYAENASNGGWLTISPDSGSVKIGQLQQLTLTAHGPKIAPPDQTVNLVIQSNDPVTPNKIVVVTAHINQPPVLTKHDTLYVRETDTLNALIPVKADRGIAAVTLVTPDTAASINMSGDSSYFIYRPGYKDAGLHLFPISMSDENSNTRIDTLIVQVLNTNRPPYVIHHMKDRVISVQSPALRYGLDSVFIDPDGDPLIYKFTGDANTIVKVFVDSVTGDLNIIPVDTGRIRLAFMVTDSCGASAFDTLNLFVRNNLSPVATTIPNVIIDKGTSRTINLDTWFSDPDSTDVLTYTANMDTLMFASINVDGSDLTMNGLNAGTSLVTVIADDGNGGTVSRSFNLIVLNNQGNIVDDYNIRVAPNPVRADANIIFELGTGKKVHIDLIAMDGKLQSVVYDGMRNTGINTIHVSLASLPDGNYLFKFTIDGKTGVIQIAKIK